MTDLTLKIEKGTGYEGDLSIVAYVDNNEAAHLDLDIGEYELGITYVEVFEDFRGLGLYKQMLQFALIAKIENTDCLVSTQRFEDTSNKIYKRWLNNENLNNMETIIIKFDEEEEELTFE